MKTIIFTFAGRRPNLELQVPLVQRIIAENENVEYHLWNFARNDADREYVKTISGERITVWNGEGAGFASPTPTEVDAQVRQFGANEHNAAYTHYAKPDFEGCQFIKIDDDVVFLETARFPQFAAAIAAHPDAVIIADTINNCCCTPTHPMLWEFFLELGIPVDDVYKSRVFANIAHTYLFDNVDEILDQPAGLVPTEDWTEINAVGYSHRVMQHCLRTIGTPHPPVLAGRDMAPRDVQRGWSRGVEYPWGEMFGDEGTFQLLPRYIMKGFTAGHLSFGAQGEDLLPRWREGYRQLAATYLEYKRPYPADVPKLSEEVSCGKRDQGLWPQ